MQTETKTEIVVAVGVAAVLAYIWWSNHQAGAGTGMEGIFPTMGAGANAVPSGASLGDIAPAAGASFNYNGGDINLPATPLDTPLGGAACGCQQPGGGGSTTTTIFGSSNDLQAFLDSLPKPAGASPIETASVYSAPNRPASNVAQQVADMAYGSGTFSAGETTRQLATASRDAFASRSMFAGMWN